MGFGKRIIEKVGELIEKLKGMDQERPVFVAQDGDWWPLQDNEVEETEAEDLKTGKDVPVVFIGVS
jgi:hypothetical protein